MLALVLQAISAKAQWGEQDSRTETRNNAGLMGDAGAKSGFFQASNPVNFPTGAGSWWHLLDVRHSTISNNYAMQFSGSFFDQTLYFRKTNNNPNQSWSKVLTANSDGILNTGEIIAESSGGRTLFTGRQVGATYSFNQGIYRAITDNPNGTVNFYYDGITNGVRKFGVRADGQGYFAGYVGINTTVPNGNLDVNGTLIAGGNTANLDSTNPDKNLSFLENTGRMIIGWNKTKGAGETDFVGNQGGGSVGGFAFYNHANNGIEKQLMWLTGDGKLFVGLTDESPNAGNYKLAVGGGMIAEAVTVKMQANWPDYVFKNDYELPSLTKVKTFIDQNHHLPEIPSADQIAKDGQNLGEMNKLLLKKVEELTLYLIEEHKRSEMQQKQLDLLTAEIRGMKNK